MASSRSIVVWLQRHLFATGIALVLLMFGVWWFAHKGKTPGSQPLIVTVGTGDIENTVTAEGSLKPSKYVDVGAQVSGQLKKLYVDVGDLVKQGQLLAEIDASVQAQKVAASKASLASLQAQLAGKRAALTLAKANAERQKNLMRDNATTRQDYDNAVNDLASSESALAQLQAQIDQAKAGLASDEAQLGYSKIYAPMAGTVIAVALNEGQTLNAVQQAPTILRIADLSTMTVQTSVSEADVAKLHTGMDVYFTTLGGGTRRWYGKLRQIWPTPQIVNNVVLYTALFDVKNEDGTLLPDMTAQVFFVTAAAHHVTTVPVGALSFEQGERGTIHHAGSGPGSPPAGGSEPPRYRHPEATPAESGGRPRRGTPATVRLVLADGKIEKRRILIGVMNRITAEVVSGLKPGDRVVAGLAQKTPGASSETERRPRFRGFP